MALNLNHEDDSIDPSTGAITFKKAIIENAQTITANYTITDGYNAMSAGPITINSGVTVTVGDGETWTVV
jgi:hypothetical protein